MIQLITADHARDIKSHPLLISQRFDSGEEKQTQFLQAEMAAINGLSAPQSFLSLRKPKSPISYLPKSATKIPSFPNPSIISRTKLIKDSNFTVRSVANELDFIPVQSSDYTDQQDGVVELETEAVSGEDIVNQVVSGFGSEGRLSFEASTGYASSSGGGGGGGSGSNGEGQEEVGEMEKLIDRTINATIVLAAGTFAITKLLTIDHDYWQVSEKFTSLIVLLHLYLCIWDWD